MAQQNGTWNVGLAAGSSLNVSNALDGSGNSIPLTMRDADNPTRNAWRRLGKFALSPSSTFSSDSFDLPAGKMLVIEAVQGSADYNNCLTSPFFGLLAIQTKVNGVFGQASGFPLAQDPRACNFVFNNPPVLTKIYADPGSSVTVFLTANQTAGGGSLEYELYGFLVDCVSAPCRLVAQ
jgi:hypothetical protein